MRIGAFGKASERRRALFVQKYTLNTGRAVLMLARSLHKQELIGRRTEADGTNIVVFALRCFQ
jgi:hypothetical protein